MAVCKSFRLTCNASIGSFCTVQWTSCGTLLPKTVNINGGDFAIFGWGFNYIETFPIAGISVFTDCATATTANVYWQVTNGTSVTESNTNSYSCDPPPYSPLPTPSLTRTPRPTRTPTPTPSVTPIFCGSGVTSNSYSYTDCCGRFITGTDAGVTVLLDYSRPSIGITN